MTSAPFAAADVRWRLRAACRGLGPAIFYAVPPPRTGKTRQAAWDEATEQARSICADCTVRDECGETGAKEEGVWGGAHEVERGVRPPSRSGKRRARPR